LIEHETNSGLGVTLNTALAHTETPLFAKIDADVVVPPDWLANILNAYNESGAALVQGKFVEQETTLADRWRAKYPSPPFGSEPRRNHPINGATILAETEALRDIGGYDEQFRRAFDDIDLMERLIDADYDIYYAPSVRSTHIRTDTWREVLHTEWAYQNNLQRGKPTSLSEIVDRLPHHIYESGRCVYLDVKYREFERLPISLLRLPYLVKWDVEYVLFMTTS
jgi:GT2 family glycosyltransferase